MNAAELAALIAAVFWALLVCVGVFVLLRLARLLSESSRLVADLRERGDALLQRAQTAVDGAQAAVDGAQAAVEGAQAAVDGAQAAVDRAGRQLDQTEAVTASMDELGSGMAEVAGQVTVPARGDDPASLAACGGGPRPPRGAMTTTDRAIAAGPAGRTAALAYGVRHALGLRRSRRRTVPGRVMERAELTARPGAHR